MVLELRAGNQTIINDVNFEYSLNMNENNRAIINLESNTSFQNSLLNLKAPISVYRNGVIEFKGKINSRSNLEGNATKLICNGAEQEYIKDNIDLSSLSNNGVYVNTASADIFEELIGNGGVTFSSGTIDTGINIDQKFSESNSWFSGILNLLSKTGQELFVNYSNDTLSIKDSLGTAEEIIGEGQTSISKIIDDFNRADSSTVGNGWIDIGTNPNKFQILNNQLYVDGVSFLEARIEKSLGKVYDISPINSEFSFFIQRDFFTLGDPSGIELYENNTLKLRIRFGTVFGPTSINETDFYNSAGTKIETIPYNAITSTNPGTFQVLSNGGGSYTINHPDGTSYAVNNPNIDLSGINKINVGYSGTQSLKFDDIYIKGITSEVFSKRILNEGTDFSSLIFQESEPTAKKVLVYGKGDGVNQIKATATSIGFVKGEDNVKTIRDPTIISESEAQIRADAELVQLEQNIETYVIPIENPNRNYQLGDLLTINAKSYGVDNKEVRIVRVIRGRQGDNEFLRIEVTNSNHSKTFKNSTQRINETALISQNNETYEQGSGNTQNPQGQINATNVAPLRIPLVIDNNVVDEVGNIRINQFNLDVDVDPFRKSAGTATAVSDLLVDGTSADEQPDVLNTSGTTQPNVSGNTSSETIVHNFGVDNFNEGISTSSWDPVGSITMNEDVDLIVCAIRTYSVTSASGADLWYRIEIDGVSYAVGQLNSNAQTGNEYVFNQTIPYQLSTIGKNIGFYLRSFSNSISIDGDVRAYGVSPSHTHGDGSLTANNHSHDDGNYTAANHEHNDGSYNIPTTEVENITIGDDVSDANNVNATGFTWELREVVSGVSTVRNSGIETFTGGNTFINGIDISDSGTYPNTQGQWQIWIYPNSVDADLVKAKVNIKHNLENI